MQEAKISITLPEEEINKFWSKTKTIPGSDCLWWTGLKNYSGYGLHLYKGHKWRSHRLAFELTNGPFLKEKHILHSCDNPSCVNPAHLSMGTHADNMRQRHERGRYNFNYNGNHYLQKDSTVVRGSNNGRSVINEAIALSIRKDFAEKKFRSKAAMARSYGVSITIIKTVINRKVWKHV
jgi:hypothetical protein